MRASPILLLSFLCLTAAISHADEPNPGIQLGTPAYAGSGCPLGSLGLALSPDALSLSLVFEAFEAKVEVNSSNRSVRKACDLVIPVQVPTGYSVLPVKGRFSGSYQLANDASARVQVIRAWSGVENARERFDFHGVAQEVFELDLSPHTQMWSPCGKNVSLRYSFVLQLQARDITTSSLVRLDKLEASPNEVAFQWRKCD